MAIDRWAVAYVPMMEMASPKMERNLKLSWPFCFIYWSLYDQDVMVLELKYKQHAEGFNGNNTFQKEVKSNALYPSRQGKGKRLK